MPGFILTSCSSSPERERKRRGRVEERRGGVRERKRGERKGEEGKKEERKTGGKEGEKRREERGGERGGEISLPRTSVMEINNAHHQPRPGSLVSQVKPLFLKGSTDPPGLVP